MILKSFNKIAIVFNYSSSLLESPHSLDTLDLLDTPNSHGNVDEEDGSNSILLTDGSAVIGVVFFLRSFSFPGLSRWFFILKYFLVELLKISSFSCLFKQFYPQQLIYNFPWFYGPWSTANPSILFLRY